MAQPPLHLVIGNYNTSSWSLRAWLVLRLARLAFVETRIPLRRPETPGRIAEVSPSGKLPVLLAEGVPIWDSLAIAEFIAELEPGIWPLDPIARAEARAISAEMHSGFADLRRLMPMDVVGRFSQPGRLPRGLAADIGRIKAIWGHCRARFASHGPFLFGTFSIADCMMAPVATRFVTHGVPIEGVIEDYVDSVMSWPDMVTWCDAAAAEQAQREAQGSLGVVAVTRPGRVLGRDTAEPPAGLPGPAVMPARPSVEVPPPPTGAAAPAATMPDGAPTVAAGDSATADDTAATDVRPAADAVAEADMPAASSPPVLVPTAADVAGADRVAEPPVPEAGPPLTELPPAAASPPAAMPGERVATAEAEPPVEPERPAPRRRLFEKAPPDVVPVATPPAAGEAGGETEPPADAPALPRPGPLPARGETPVGAGAAARPRPGSVPAGSGQAGSSSGEDQAASSGKGSGAPAGPKLGWIRRPVPTEQLDADAPFAADEVPRPRPSTRPGSPAVKPIGGGILRRR